AFILCASRAAAGAPANNSWGRTAYQSVGVVKARQARRKRRRPGRRCPRLSSAHLKLVADETRPRLCWPLRFETARQGSTLEHPNRFLKRGPVSDDVT